MDKPRIFISYAHKNEDLKNEFRSMIRPLEREGHWQVWDDRWLLPGDNWNEEIMRHLAEANVIVLMLTAAFFDSDYIYDVEMTNAIQRHIDGDALMIGVVVDDCLWEKTPLRSIQILPKDALPVSRSLNRNEIWKTIANTIQHTFAVRSGDQKRKGGWNSI
ncbi:toll/interleukin-1 receptor domain-containing protein [Spirosoma aureum]|uniref:Toll/interleukin-1 receptor domain-containing protein n=1 Tax=Spirosoma aureum TaxID=2692134 RepID=A0A6G9AQG6_9BACT|nr:toll/interleukin-1 receptor domain-containing protein [Spirosoma aureum]QIP14717.1 toll/interleukin-1 receptor domain-containing protein [Spirosoma aureum]